MRSPVDINDTFWRGRGSGDIFALIISLKRWNQHQFCGLAPCWSVNEVFSRLFKFTELQWAMTPQYCPSPSASCWRGRIFGGGFSSMLSAFMMNACVVLINIHLITNNLRHELIKNKKIWVWLFVIFVKYCRTEHAHAPLPKGKRIVGKKTVVEIIDFKIKEMCYNFKY